MRSVASRWPTAAGLTAGISAGTVEGRGGDEKGAARSLFWKEQTKERARVNYPSMNGRGVDQKHQAPMLATASSLSHSDKLNQVQNGQAASCGSIDQAKESPGRIGWQSLSPPGLGEREKTKEQERRPSLPSKQRQRRPFGANVPRAGSGFDCEYTWLIPPVECFVRHDTAICGLCTMA